MVVDVVAARWRRCPRRSCLPLTRQGSPRRPRASPRPAPVCVSGEPEIRTSGYPHDPARIPSAGASGPRRRDGAHAARLRRARAEVAAAAGRSRSATTGSPRGRMPPRRPRPLRPSRGRRSSETRRGRREQAGSAAATRSTTPTASRRCSATAWADSEPRAAVFRRKSGPHVQSVAPRRTVRRGTRRPRGWL